MEQGGAGVSQALYGEEFESFVQERLDLSLGKLFSLSEGVPMHGGLLGRPRTRPLEIQYNGGWRIILPLYSDTMECTVMALSDDGGETWTFSEPSSAWQISRLHGAAVRWNHCGYMRDNGPIPQRVVEAESTDGGMTWTIGKDRQDLFDPGVGSDLVKLENGNWVFVNNDNQFGRFSLAVACRRMRQDLDYRRHIALDTAATPEISTIHGLADRTQYHHLLHRRLQEQRR